MEDQKAKEIIISATMLLMRYGVKSQTMDDIARGLGISKKTLYKYVTDKNDLVKKAVSLTISGEHDALCDLVDFEGNAIDKIVRINDRISDKLQNLQPAVIYDLQRYHPEAWQIMQDHKRNFIFQKIKENLIEGIEEGLYRKSINPEIVAQIYITLTDTIFDSELFNHTAKDYTAIHDQVVRYHLRGIASEKGVEYIKKIFNNKKYEL